LALFLQKFHQTVNYITHQNCAPLRPQRRSAGDLG